MVVWGVSLSFSFTPIQLHLLTNHINLSFFPKPFSVFVVFQVQQRVIIQAEERMYCAGVTPDFVRWQRTTLITHCKLYISQCSDSYLHYINHIQCSDFTQRLHTDAWHRNSHCGLLSTIVSLTFVLNPFPVAGRWYGGAPLRRIGKCGVVDL